MKPSDSGASGSGRSSPLRSDAGDLGQLTSGIVRIGMPVAAGMTPSGILDEVQLRIKGRKHWLWRAVDQDGIVLDILVQERRNQEAAERFLRRLVEGNGYQPRVVITDKLASYPPAVRRVLPGVEHRRHKGLNTRAEHAHRPTRRRERVLQRFTSPEHAP
jgi:transposase-like protein